MLSESSAQPFGVFQKKGTGEVKYLGLNEAVDTTSLRKLFCRYSWPLLPKNKIVFQRVLHVFFFLPKLTPHQPNMSLLSTCTFGGSHSVLG